MSIVRSGIDTSILTAKQGVSFTGAYGTTWGEQLDTVLTRYLQERGDGAARADGGKGRVLPLLTGGDALDILAAFVDGIKTAIVKVQRDLGDRVPRSDFVGGDYILTSGIHNGWDSLLSHVPGVNPADGVASVKADQGKSISVKEYMAAIPVENKPGIRFPLTNPAWRYQPALPGLSVSEGVDNSIQFVYQMMADYQRGVTAVSHAIAACGDSTTLPADRCQACVAACSSLANDLDTLAGYSPPSMKSIVIGATKAALDASENTIKEGAEALGQVAGEAGNIAGNVAGAFGKGFFSQAGLLTIVILSLFAYKEL